MPDNKPQFTLDDILAEYSNKSDKTSSASSKAADTPPPAAFSSVTAPHPKPSYPPKPAQPAPKPVQQAPKPVQPAPKPVQQVPKSVQQAPKPVQQAPKPVQQAPKPVQQAPKPVQQAPKPVQQAPKPVQQAPKPVQTAPPPLQQTQRPVQQAQVNSQHPAKKIPERKKTNTSFHGSAGGTWNFKQYKFLFKQLINRDFKGRYKRAALGVLWSMLSPMFIFAAQAIVFTYFFNRTGNHFISHLVIGNIIFHFFTDSVNAGMVALAANGRIISKIKVPKGIFILSKQVSCLLNLGLTMIVMFGVVFFDGLRPTPMYFALVYPIFTMSVFNIGCGMILSVWFVFFKDTQYLFGIFTRVLMYFSAIFYSVERYSETLQTVFYFNPVYCYITCCRSIIMRDSLPCNEIMMLCTVYAILAIAIGLAMYNKNHNKLAYYF